MLPQAPINGPHAAYLTDLVRELERELRNRAQRSERDGVVYLGSDQPVSLISPSGTVYRLTVDDAGELVTEAVT